MELLSFKRVIDITDDSKVTKKVLKEGEGTITANEGATVTSKNLIDYIVQPTICIWLDICGSCI